MKTQLVNVLSKLFGFRVQTIDTSDKAVFTLKGSGLYYKQGKKINTSDMLTSAQSQSGRFFNFIMAVRPDQADPKFKYSCITCRACVKIPRDVDGKDASSNTQILKTPHYLLVHLES